MTDRAISFGLRGSALIVVLFLQACWLAMPTPIGLKAAVIVLALASVWSPPAGLLVFAGLSPLSTVLNDLSGAGLPSMRLLEQLALAVALGALARYFTRTDHSRLGAPMALLGAVTFASGVTLLPAEVAALAPGFDGARLIVSEFVHGHAAESPRLVLPLISGVLALEYGLIAWAAERIVRDQPGLAERVVLLALIGHAGAGLLDVQRIVGAALRSGDFAGTFLNRWMNARVSMQTDVNAAGSLFVLAGVAAVGLLRRSIARALGVLALGAMVAGGLWVTGSRVAMLATIGAVGLGVGWMAVRLGGRARLLAGVAAVAVIVGAVTLALNYPAGRNDTAGGSIATRLKMARAGVEMFKTAPAFGIGVTRFYERSADVIGPDLFKFAGSTHENAHNNFVQILAEQGLAGLIALFVALGVLALAAARAESRQPSATRLWLAMGIVGAIGTWMTGHPLLVPEFAFVFWMFGGVLAGTTPAPVGLPAGAPAGDPAGAQARVPSRTSARARFSTLGRLAVLAGLLVVLASIPIRAAELRNKAWLEHLAIGLSVWQHDDSQRYREGGRRFIVFLPAQGQPVKLPLRRAPGAPDPLDVQFSLDGRVFHHEPLTGDEWRDLVLTVPAGPRNFEAVEVTAMGPSGAGTAAGPAMPQVLLRIGKDGQP